MDSGGMKGKKDPSVQADSFYDENQFSYPSAAFKPEVGRRVGKLMQNHAISRIPENS